MASFVEQATLRIDNQASREIRALNRDILNLLRNARKINKLNVDLNLKDAQRQVRSLVKDLNKLPRQKTVNVNVNQSGRVPNIPRTPAPPPPGAPPVAPPGGGGGGGNPNSPWRNGTFTGVVRIATAYATFTGAVNIAQAGITATNEAQAQTTRELSIFRNDAATRAAINDAATQAALNTSRLDLTRTRGIATDLVLGGITNQNLPEFTKLFSNTESAIGALFPGLEKSVTLFNNKMVNLANASDDIVRSSALVKGGAQGIAAAGESFNAATSIAALRGSGLAPTINEKGLANFILLTDALGQNIASGVSRLQKELFTPAEQAGAGSGLAKGAVRDLEARGLRGFTREQQRLFSQDPATFIEDVLGPRIRAQGVDTTNREDLKAFIQTAGFNATSQRLILSTLTSIEERAQQLRAVSGLDPNQPNAGTEGNLALATTDLIKSFNTLSSQVLTPLFERAAPFVSSFATFVEKTALTASKMDDLGLAAATVAGTFTAFSGGRALLNFFNPLTASAAALDGSAAALTRAAISLGGAGVADAAPDATGGNRRGLFGRIASGFALGAGAIGGISAISNPSKELLEAPRVKLGADDFLRWVFGTNAPPVKVTPPTPKEQDGMRFAEMTTRRTQLEEAISDIKRSPLPDAATLGVLQTELANVNNAISLFDQTFQTGAQQASMTLSTGLEAGANLLTGGLAGAFAAGADLIAARITGAINNAVINAPRMPQATAANTGTMSPTE